MNKHERKYTTPSLSDSVFPCPDKLRDLSCNCYQGGSWEHLLDYNGVRYHLLLDFNLEDRDCVENRYLQKCYDAMEEDDDHFDEIFYGCLELFWPFVQKVDAAQERNGKSNDEINQAKKDAVVKIQVKTTAGTLQAVEHQEYFKYPEAEPVDNTFSNLTLFSNAEVERIGEIDADIHKVMIRGNEYCLKTVYRNSESSFIREVEKLAELCEHPNIVNLIGVVDAGEGKVDGMVLGLISGIPLSQITSVTMSQKEKWKRQISETITFLHRRGVVWGDAKPANILIDDKTGDAVLIDFGEGTTKGWVDHNLGGTTKGDIQGLHRIIKYLDKLEYEQVTIDR